MKIVMIDDHKIVLDGLKAMLLGSAAQVVGAFQRGKDLKDFLSDNEVDIALMDIRMPGNSGLDLCHWIKANKPQMKVIFLSANLDSASLAEAIRLGAMGFLSKDSSEEELLNALNSVYKGNPYFGESIREEALQSYMQHIQFPELSRHKKLTSRELDIIQAFGEGLTYKEIAERLNISKKTVESHKDRLLKKLELKTLMDLVKYGIREGIIDL